MSHQIEIKAIELKNKIQAHILRELKELSPEQEIEYFRQKPNDRSLQTWWETVKKCQSVRLKKTG